ncbi:MAG: ABC transporter permease [Anaerolineae bacterium]|nr:ABC transporter permease [Anaerolineae bacterium]
MKHILHEAFRSPKFVTGFVIFMAILALVVFYPLFVTDHPLAIIGQGTFFPPGIYVSVYDTTNAPQYTMMLPEAEGNRIGAKLGDVEREAMREWLIDFGIPRAEIDIDDTAKLMTLWDAYYDPALRFQGMTSARQKYFARLDASLEGLLVMEPRVIAVPNTETGAFEASQSIELTDFVNVNEVANVRVLPLGTDNFGRDMLTQLVSAIGTSLQIGLVAGTVATLIGLTLGLMAGYIGGLVDDVIMFFTNLFTAIPGIVLLILISYSIGQENRGAVTVAVVIGVTSWVWTTRAVRAQVISLRNRDHVNLSKLSGHSIFHIIFADILPYILSYVVMAFILQISSGILAEAGLSILGLGPKTTDVPTLGLMMRWAMIYSAHILNKWWAFFPVIVAIALISFSLNLMNTGLDQVFNPALRE